MRLGRNTDPGVTAFKAIVHFKDGDGRWFQQETRNCVRNGDQVAVVANLKGDWQSLDPVVQPYGPWNLRRVKEAGIKLYAGGGKLSKVTLQSHQPQPANSLADLTASFIQAPANASHNQRLESRFTLSRIYKNPFDPRQIDLAVEFAGPDGAITRAIAFYFQDYDAHYKGKREILTPKGTPEWHVRFTPDWRVPMHGACAGRAYSNSADRSRDSDHRPLSRAVRDLD
jgi:hypothetical protein